MIEEYVPTSEVQITPDAVKALEDILTSMGDAASKVVGLRVFVTGGGCSGFSYGFSFVQGQPEEDDTIYDHGIVKLLVDPLSYQYLVGATVDYKTDLHGSQFSIKNNPNATTTCGCGNSFA
ncbi:Iron-sulfur cluster insertion protein ErpA [compost metagenome]